LGQFGGDLQSGLHIRLMRGDLKRCVLPAAARTREEAALRIGFDPALDAVYLELDLPSLLEFGAAPYLDAIAAPADFPIGVGEARQNRFGPIFYGAICIQALIQIDARKVILFAEAEADTGETPVRFRDFAADVGEGRPGPRDGRVGGYSRSLERHL